MSFARKHVGSDPRVDCSAPTQFFWALSAGCVGALSCNSILILKFLPFRSGPFCYLTCQMSCTLRLLDFHTFVTSAAVGTGCSDSLEWPSNQPSIQLLKSAVSSDRGMLLHLAVVHVSCCHSSFRVFRPPFLPDCWVFYRYEPWAERLSACRFGCVIAKTVPVLISMLLVWEALEIICGIMGLSVVWQPEEVLESLV